MENMQKLVDAIVEMVSDKVLEKLVETDKMKNFLKNQTRTVNADDIDDFEPQVREICENILNNCSIEASIST